MTSKLYTTIVEKGARKGGKITIPELNSQRGGLFGGGGGGGGGIQFNKH